MKQSMNILLVEDDEVDVMNVQRAFKKNSMNNPIYVAQNGLEALKILRGEGEDHPPSIRTILLDLNMPKMGGIEFLTELRKDPNLRSASVFVMTTSDEESDKMAAYNFNVAGYILKPLSFEKFTDTVSLLNSYWKLCEQPINYN